jgi:hypothetical protein
MIGIWGKRLFGRVDYVPGLGHVATRFFHFLNVPLVPLGSQVVPEEGAGALPIAASGKSIAVAYVRAICVLAASMSVASVFAASGGDRWVAGMGALAGFGAVFLTYRASFLKVTQFDRARQLAKECELPAEAILALAVHYGEIDIADAVACARPPKGELRRVRIARRRKRERDGQHVVKSSEVPYGTLLETRTLHAIKFRCPSCEAATKVPASLGGTKGKCPKCLQAVRVPARVRESRAA